jgi:hypothetical protein
MDSQLFDWRPFLMDLEGQEAPNSLGRTQVTGLEILLNLVQTDRGRRTVRTFINVLCDVLNDADTPTDLNIDMGLIALQQVRVIWDNPAVVDHNCPVLYHLLEATAATASIFRVSMLLRQRLLTTGLWESFCAKYVARIWMFTTARRVFIIFWTARIVDYVCPHQFGQFWVLQRIRELSRDHFINMFCLNKALAVLNEKDQMHMRQTSLLILNGVEAA